MDAKGLHAIMCALLLVPLAGSVAPIQISTLGEDGLQLIDAGQQTTAPVQTPVSWASPGPWWTWTSMDSDRNGIHDSLQTASGPVNVGLSYDGRVTDSNRLELARMGHEIHLELPSVNAVLIGDVDASDVHALSQLEGVVMVERYGSLVFYGDIQTPAVKASNSTEYPVGAWDLGVSGHGVNIALTDTGVDNEHPGLSGKFVAGYDAVCYMHTDPQLSLIHI